MAGDSSAEIADVWRYGTVIRSWLLDLAALALADPGEFDGVRGYVDDSGEGRWTVEDAVAPRRAGAGHHRRRSSSASPAATPTCSPTGSSPPCATSSAATTLKVRGLSRGHRRRPPSAPPRRATDNPLSDDERDERRAPPCVLVVYGASGDLTSRKILPGLERLHRRRQLPSAFAVVGTARTEMDDDDFREAVPQGRPGRRAGLGRAGRGLPLRGRRLHRRRTPSTG